MKLTTSSLRPIMCSGAHEKVDRWLEGMMAGRRQTLSPEPYRTPPNQDFSSGSLSPASSSDHQSTSSASPSFPSFPAPDHIVKQAANERTQSPGSGYFHRDISPESPEYVNVQVANRGREPSGHFQRDVVSDNNDSNGDTDDENEDVPSSMDDSDESEYALRPVDDENKDADYSMDRETDSLLAELHDAVEHAERQANQDIGPPHLQGYITPDQDMGDNVSFTSESNEPIPATPYVVEQAADQDIRSPHYPQGDCIPDLGVSISMESNNAIPGTPEYVVEYEANRDMGSPRYFQDIAPVQGEDSAYADQDQIANYDVKYQNYNFDTPKYPAEQAAYEEVISPDCHHEEVIPIYQNAAAYPPESSHYIQYPSIEPDNSSFVLPQHTFDAFTQPAPVPTPVPSPALVPVPAPQHPRDVYGGYNDANELSGINYGQVTETQNPYLSIPAPVTNNQIMPTQEVYRMSQTPILGPVTNRDRKLRRVVSTTSTTWSRVTTHYTSAARSTLTRYSTTKQETTTGNDFDPHTDEQYYYDHQHPHHHHPYRRTRTPRGAEVHNEYTPDASFPVPNLVSYLPQQQLPPVYRSRYSSLSPMVGPISGNRY